MKKHSMFMVIIILVIALSFIWIPSITPREDIRKDAKKKVILKSESSRLSEVKNEAFLDKHEELSALLKADNVPIEFYGIVVDESGDPITEVEVAWAIVKSGSFAPSLGLPASARGFVRTADDGRFSVTNESGYTLGIKSLYKAGYHEVNGTVKSYGYGSTSEPHQPEQLEPVKYLMIRDGGEQSVKKQIPLRFDWDGEIKNISISLAERSEVMIITPKTVGQNPNSQDYDWSIIIQMKKAQLVVGRIGDARVAPTDGYLPEIKLKNNVEGQRGSEANALVYFKTDDNRFGEIRFSAYSDRGASDPTGSLSIRWNPNGGRVFE